MTSDYKGKFALTGLGLPNEMRELVKDDTVKEFALWDPEQLGYTIEVGENGVAIVGPPTRFNADNIDDCDFKPVVDSIPEPVRPCLRTDRADSGIVCTRPLVCGDRAQRDGTE